MAEQTRMESRTEGERIAHLEGQIAHLATKADIQNLRAEMNSNTVILNSNIAELRAEMNSNIAELRAEMNSNIAILNSNIALLKSDNEGLRAELRMIRWIIGIAIPAAIAVTGIVVQVLNNLP